jgi:hypothetical protein
MAPIELLTVNEPSITIAFLALLAGAGYLISQHVGQAYQQLAIIFCPNIADSRQFRLLDWIAVERLPRRDLGTRRRSPVLV